jgi:hypothetical protein
MGHPAFVAGEETAGPSASLGMTRFRVVAEVRDESRIDGTAGPSTSLGMTSGVRRERRGAVSLKIDCGAFSR